MIRLSPVVALALLACLAGAAGAQDEIPKDAPPAPKSDLRTPQKPAAPDDEPAAPPPGTMFDQPVAVLQALDKITARVRRLTIKVGQTAPFGTLSIAVEACRKAPPEDPPESAAFLKITEGQAGDPAPKLVFSGWMFASSPALSAMDHPVYDISVVDCAGDGTVAVH